MSEPLDFAASLIYDKYPRKVARGAAIKAIRAAMLRVVNERDSDDGIIWLSARVEQYAASPAGQKPPKGEPDYRPYPATWMNQERYHDDADEWGRPNNTMSNPVVDADELYEASKRGTQ